MEEQRKKQYINLPNLKIIDIFPTRTITWVEKATSLETALQVCEGNLASSKVFIDFIMCTMCKIRIKIPLSNYKGYALFIIQSLFLITRFTFTSSP